MKTTLTVRIAAALTVGLLSAAMVAPAVAGASQAVSKRPADSASRVRAVGAPVAQAAQRQPGEQVRNRVENVLRARKARFDAVSKNLNARIGRLEALASKVESAGGDPAAARVAIDEAKTALAEAITLEADAVALFRQVPEAEDRRAAFREAREAGREAVAMLKQARVEIREAARELRLAVVAIREQSGADD